MSVLISKEQLINLLNGDLQLEYSAALQYIQHASVMTGAQFDAIREHLGEHADEEMEHAKLLSDRIAYMGGTPVAAPDMSAIRLSDNARYMLALDLDGERTAITRYKERVEQANLLKEYGLAQMLMEILSDEEEHEDDLVNSLGTGMESTQVPPAQNAEQFVKLARMEQKRKS